MNYSDTTVIIPTLNEEKNISNIISKINKYKGIKIIVSDDGSKDNTQKLAKKYAKVIDRKKEPIKGLTASVIDAVKATKTKYIIVMDADLQHPVETIEKIRNELKKYKIVIATRKRTLKWKLSRKIISKIAIILGRLRLLFRGMIILDPVSGFFGIHSTLFQKTLNKSEHKFEKQGYKVLFDILKYTPNKHIEEIYYEFKTRKHGTSKIGRKQIISYLKAIIK